MIRRLSARRMDQCADLALTSHSNKRIPINAQGGEYTVTGGRTGNVHARVQELRHTRCGVSTFDTLACGKSSLDYSLTDVSGVHLRLHRNVGTNSRCIYSLLFSQP